MATLDKLAQRFPFVAGMLLGSIPFAVVAISQGV
jgi:hypothetical protein